MSLILISIRMTLALIFRRWSKKRDHDFNLKTMNCSVLFDVLQREVPRIHTNGVVLVSMVIFSLISSVMLVYSLNLPFCLRTIDCMGIMWACVVTWALQRRLKYPASRMYAQPFGQAQIKLNIKAPRHWSLWGETTGDWWIPLTNGQ